MKIVRFNRLFHIGSMNKHLRGSNFQGDSYHGGALSLSPSPADWVPVLKTDYPLWEFEHPGHRFLWSESITSSELEEVQNWAQRMGFVTIEKNPYAQGPLNAKRFVKVTEAFWLSFPEPMHDSIRIEYLRYLTMAYADQVLGLDGVFFETTQRQIGAATLPVVPSVGVLERALKTGLWKHFKCNQSIEEAKGCERLAVSV